MVLNDSSPEEIEQLFLKKFKTERIMDLILSAMKYSNAAHQW